MKNRWKNIAHSHLIVQQILEPSYSSLRTDQLIARGGAELVELYVSMAVRIRQQLFHLDSRTEIAHVPSPLVENFNLRHENTVHWSVVGESRFSSDI